jgi:hypothetical protein
MSGKVTAWQLFDQVLRTFFLSIWRLPLLVLATVIVYATVWWVVLRDAPYVAVYDPIDPLERLVTIAVIFPPLAVAVMRLAILGKTRLRDWWQPSVWRISGLIFLALLAFFVMTAFVIDPLIYYSMVWPPETPLWIQWLTWTSMRWIYVIGVIAIGARLVWFVPALAVGRTESVEVAFREIRGNYRLALLVCLLTVMPLYIFNYYFGYWSYGGARRGALLFESELQAWLWFLKDGVVIACRCILLSALAAVIYRAEFGSRGATAP